MVSIWPLLIFVKGMIFMDAFIAFSQLVVTFIVGTYFFVRLKNESGTEKQYKSEYKREAELLNKMRHIHLSEPMTESVRPSCVSEIIGQEDGIRALKSALWGKYPQHVIIYGPPGVGKTAAARVILEEVKKSPMTPFLKNAPFIEADASVMRCDERGFTDPLIGSVHDPIYQGSGSFGQNGIPQPMPGAVSRAHGGVLFLDEIGELPNEQLNKLLKVLEDRRVLLESSYYSSSNKKIPAYIRDMFENGLPADFRLIGTTTRSPETIPEAVRSRCVEIYFNPLMREDILSIIKQAQIRCGILTDKGVNECIADYAKNGRDAIKILQSAMNLVRMEGRQSISIDDAKWVISSSRYKRTKELYTKDGGKIIDISLIKPLN